MSRRPFALAASLLLAFPLAHSLPAAHAADVIVEGGTCTVVHSPVERDNVLALSGVFAANWSAEILRDIPGAAEDMSLARIWHADKTSEQLADMPAEVRAAVDRVNEAGQRVGYREDDATAPLRVLIDRNDHRRANQAWHTVSPEGAKELLDASRRSGTPTLLSGTRDGLSVAADEAWMRAWERTPGAAIEADASLAELRLCASGTSGTVDRGDASTTVGQILESRVPDTRPQLVGVPLGHLHTSLIVALLEEAGSLKGLFH